MIQKVLPYITTIFLLIFIWETFDHLKCVKSALDGIVYADTIQETNEEVKILENRDLLRFTCSQDKGGPSKACQDVQQTSENQLHRSVINLSNPTKISDVNYTQVLQDLDDIKETMTLSEATNQHDIFTEYQQIQGIYAARQQNINTIIKNAYGTLGQNLGMLISLCLEGLASLITTIGVAKRDPNLVLCMPKIQIFKIILQDLYSICFPYIPLPSDIFWHTFTLNIIPFICSDHIALKLFFTRFFKPVDQIYFPIIIVMYISLIECHTQIMEDLDEGIIRSQNLKNRKNMQNRKYHKSFTHYKENNWDQTVGTEKVKQDTNIISSKMESTAKSNFSIYRHKILTKKIEATPELIYHASLYGHKDVVRCILANHSSSIDITQKEKVTGFTALHLASSGGHLSVVQQLMNVYGNEACIQLLNRDLQTGLELAAHYGRKDVVQTILNSIRKKHVRDEMYQNILRLSLVQSLEQGHHEIAQRIHDKFGDFKNKISEDIYFETYIERFFVICRQIENFKFAKTKREKKQQAIKMENKIIYQEFICNILKTKKPAGETVPLNLEDFECPVCFEYMCSPLKIFACHNDHYICSICLLSPTIKACPICRDDFNKRKPKPCLDAENRAEKHNELYPHHFQ